MNEGKINKQILDGISENCEGDKIIEKFLRQLIFEEINHSGSWWWKDSYKKHVDKYSADWEESNED